MDNVPGWHQDPEREDQERYWNGSGSTDRVRPAGKARSAPIPGHVPELHRALAAATADIDAVEDRLSTLFDRTEGTPRPGLSPASPSPSRPDPHGDEIVELFDADDVVDAEPVHEEFDTSLGRDTDDDEYGTFSELDAALAAEEPERSTRRFFRRRSPRPAQ